MELYLICVSPGSHLFFYGQDVKWWEVITHLFSRAGFPVPSSSSSWVSARSRFTALVSCEISSVFSCRGELLSVGIPCVTLCLFSEPRRATPPYLYPSPPPPSFAHVTFASNCPNWRHQTGGFIHDPPPPHPLFLSTHTHSVFIANSLPLSLLLSIRKN